MNKKNYKVYVHENKINGKRYVGITHKNNPNERWRNGKGYSYNTHFGNSIKKYGWDNFYHYIIAYNLTQEEAEHTEKQFIELWDLMNDKNGYNMTSGGEGTNDVLYSEEILAMKSALITELNKKKRKRVVNLNNGVVYESISEANKSRGVCDANANIGLCCAGKMKYVGVDENGYGVQWCFEDDYEAKKASYQPILYCKSMNKKAVICLTDLSVYETAKLASERMVVDSSSIIKCCKGKQKTITNKEGVVLKWMYYDQYIEISNQEIFNYKDNIR